MTEPRTTVGRLVIEVTGRPAPQGSKKQGQYGQMREQSAYLPAWRAAVKRAAYEAYMAHGVYATELPLFVGPVTVDIRFRLDHGDRVDGPPDIDKLSRATLDALGSRKSNGARVFEDDSRVVLLIAAKLPADSRGAGARIEVAPFYAPDGVVTLPIGGTSG